MARGPKPKAAVKPSPSQEPRPEVVAEEGVKPLRAVHQIVYGDARVAAPGSIFTPVSEDERAELLIEDENGVSPAAELDAIDQFALASAAPADPADTDVTDEDEDEDADAYAAFDVTAAAATADVTDAAAVTAAVTAAATADVTEDEIG